MRLRRLVMTVIALVGLTLLVGYGTSFARTPACKALFVEDLLSHQVQGREFGGAAAMPEASEVSSRVLLPFSVELSLSLPRDIHRAQYFATCVALPWRLDLVFRSEVVPL